MTIIDVADAAGVSKSTVSRVINGNPTVAPPVVRKVRAAMDDLGYVPSANRRGPKPKGRRRSGVTISTLGLLIVGRTRELLQFPSTGRFLAGLTEAAQSEDVSLVILEMPDPAVVPAIVRNGGLDGLVVLGEDLSHPLADRFHPLPIVWQGGLALELPPVDHVLVNGKAIGLLAADYLLERGCRDIAYLNHDRQHPSFVPRYAMFREYLVGRGKRVRCYEMPEREIREADMWLPSRLQADYSELVDQVLGQDKCPDGIFVPTDQQAAVLHAALKERGIRPGEDVITISCNNDAQWLATMYPRPATIDPRTDEQGRLAVRRLLERIANPTDDPVVMMVTPRLVLGETA